MARQKFRIRVTDDMANLIGEFLEQREQFDRIVSFILSTDASSSLNEFVKGVATRAQIDVDAVQPVVFTLWNVVNMVRVRREPVDQTLEQLTKAIERYGWAPLDKEQVQEWHEMLPKLKDTVPQITPDSSLMISWKATSLCYEHQAVLHKARLITDIRPVFNSSATQIFEMVVTHALVIDYSDGSEKKEIHLTLDASDVLSLREQCDRAELKARTIKEAMRESAWKTIVLSDPETSKG